MKELQDMSSSAMRPPVLKEIKLLALAGQLSLATGRGRLIRNTGLGGRVQ